MGARTHRELHAWQLANELRQQVFQFTRRPLVAKDEDYCRQIKRAANSACHNTAEGFYKYRHKEFAHSLRVARGELGEVDDQLEAGWQQAHLEEEEQQRLRLLCGRALAANAGLLQYLERDKKDVT